VTDKPAKPEYYKFMVEDKSMIYIPMTREGMEVMEAKVYDDKVVILFKNQVTVRALRMKESTGLKDLGIV